ncbi:MAG: hypothetical protein Satyrvirus38_9, partial [Satyrvirus sp.]
GAVLLGGSFNVSNNETVGGNLTVTGTTTTSSIVATNYNLTNDNVGGTGYYQSIVPANPKLTNGSSAGPTVGPGGNTRDFRRIVADDPDGGFLAITDTTLNNVILMQNSVRWNANAFLTANTLITIPNNMWFQIPLNMAGGNALTGPEGVNPLISFTPGDGLNRLVAPAPYTFLNHTIYVEATLNWLNITSFTGTVGMAFGTKPTGTPYGGNLSPGYQRWRIEPASNISTINALPGHSLTLSAQHSFDIVSSANFSPGIDTITLWAYQNTGAPQQVGNVGVDNSFLRLYFLTI